MPRKLSRLTGDSEDPVVWPQAYFREPTTGVDRLRIAPRQDPLGVLCELAAAMQPEYYLLYVLLGSRGNSECGRYQSPPLALVDVQIFVQEFHDLLANDARQELWIGSMPSDDLLVYDTHGLVYAYGPLDEFERILRGLGFEPGTFKIPAPHVHHYHAEYDELESRLLAHWDWIRSELQDGDGE